ncbi:MAG: hypothetical protein L0Y71_02400 [Gemmataceae bacterium]|nr:hypothetical protein [Gemmataceae bacterium]
MRFAVQAALGDLQVAALALLIFPCEVSAADVTLTIVSKDKVMMGTYKVVVKGVLKIDKGESYVGLNGHLLHEDSQVTYPITWVSITEPQKQEDGTWKDGSYEYFGYASIEGNWAAVANMTYINKSGKMTPFVKAVGFKLP